MFMKIKDIAKVCHQVNKAYCESRDDLTHSDWEDAPQWQRDTVIKGVVFHIGHPDASPSDSHKSWLEFRDEEGWKYGDKKSESLKTHPYFLPFDKLPKGQQSKDFIFKAIVDCLR